MSPSLPAVLHRGRAHSTPTQLHGHSRNIIFITFSSADNLVTVSEDKTIRRWHLSDGHGEVVKEVVGCAVAVSPESPHGRRMAMGGKDGKVRLWDIGTPTNVSKSNGRHEHPITSLSFSPDSSQLVTGAQDGTMLVWSSTTLERVAGPFRIHTDSVWCICYSRDGSRVASCDRQNVLVWDCATWNRATICEPAWSLAWSSDGGILFSGCVDGTIKLYDPQSGRLLASCSAHTDVVFAIALSHNAKFIATASWDKTVRLWEAVTLQQIGPCLTAHDSPIHSIAMSCEDTYLASGSRDGNIRVWDLKAVAPDLFKGCLLHPNRRPTNAAQHSSSTQHSYTPSRDPRPSNGLHHDGPQTPISHKDSDHSSTGSKSPERHFWSIFRRQHERGDTSTHGGSTHTHGSSSSLHSQEGDLVKGSSSGGRSLTHSSLHDPIINLPPSSTGLSLIQEIQSKPDRDLTGYIIREGDYPVAGGSQGDIYRGTLQFNGKDMPVAIKVIKRYTSQGNDQSKQRRLRREIKLWMKLDHKNVIPMLGTTRDYGNFTAMVCPWVEHGSLTSFLNRHDNELTVKRRFVIIDDVALGLEYLHSRSVVHGDISGSNILIYSNGRACISDFGLSFMEDEIEGSSIALTYQVKGTLRWTAPELLWIGQPESEESGDARRIFPTSESDVYSFGGIVLYVLSGKMPYHYYPRDEAVILAISRGELPRRPSSTSVITDDQWSFLQLCWSFEAADRPDDSEMVTFAHEQLSNAVRVADRVRR